MFASALLQYSSADHTFSSNVRFRWEYRPGSEFFVVWTDEQDTNPLEPMRGNIALRNRAFVIKMTRLFRSRERFALLHTFARPPEARACSNH